MSKSSQPGGRFNLSVSVGRRPRFFRTFLLADQAVPSIISATLSPNMGSPPKGSSPQSTSGVIVLGVPFFFFAFFLGTGVFLLGVTKRRRFFALGGGPAVASVARGSASAAAAGRFFFFTSCVNVCNGPRRRDVLCHEKGGFL